MATAVHDKVNFTFSMDRSTRDDFSKLCDTLGIPMSSAANALVKQAVRDQKVTFSALDKNGFTPAEAAELQRRFTDIKNGKFETHNLLDEENV